MKKIKYQLVLVALVLGVLMTACASGRGMGSSKKCGCGLNKGFVGY